MGPESPRVQPANKGVYPGPIDTRMGEALTLEKASPADAARAIVAGIIAGDEEIFPDKMSRGRGRPSSRIRRD